MKKQTFPNPDTEVAVVPKLKNYDWIVVNSSGGKDSQVSLDKVIEVAKAQGFPLSRIVVVHADLGEMEWPGTKELTKEHADHYGLRFEVEKRPQGDLLQHIEERGMWPDSKNRYCTSDHKRGQIARLFTRLTKEMRDVYSRQTDGRAVGLRNSGRPSSGRIGAGRKSGETEPLTHVDRQADRVQRGATDQGQLPGTVTIRPSRPRKVRFLNVFGFRAEESPARKKKVPFEKDVRLTNTLRHVDIWLPVHHWTLVEVWKRIKRCGTRPHWAYARGMGRLSCRFCIFAPKKQLVLSAQQPENKELLERYVQVQLRIGHKFTHKLGIDEVKILAEAGTVIPDDDKDDGCWNM